MTGLAGLVAALGTALATTSGDLDSGFGNGGVVATGISQHGNDSASAVAIQGDGKVVVVGVSRGEFSVVRYLADGLPDATFGGGDGIVTAGFGAGKEAAAEAVAIQADGKIVVAGKVAPPFDLGGESPPDFAIARFNSDGTLDTDSDADPGTHFSTDGKATLEFAPEEHGSAQDIAIQTDGKIVVVGSTSALCTAEPCDAPDFAVARYLANGSLDPAFSGDGKQTTEFPGMAFANGVAIQGDGKIVVAGDVTDPSTFERDWALARYDAAGSLDAGFGSGGTMIHSFSGGGEGSAHDVGLGPGGQIVAAGDWGGFTADFALASFEADGAADTAFGGGDGEVLTDFGEHDFVSSIEIGGGLIAAAGRSHSDEFGGPGTFAVARYDLTDGDPDTTFSTDGRLTTDFGSNTADSAGGVAIDSGGRVVAAGSARGIETHGDFIRELAADLVVTRYETDGDLDPTFGGDGIVETQVGSAFGDRANGVAVQDDGKVVAAGWTIDETGTDDENLAIVRYLADGSPDPSFGGGDGIVTTDLSESQLPDYALAVAIQPDGKVVVAGSSDGDFAVARFETDGDPDLPFGGGDGLVVTDLADFDEARSIALQPDGKIVVAGAAEPTGLGLARYTAAGAPDPTFSGDGKLTDTFSEAFAAGHGLTLQPNGAIVVTGTTAVGGETLSFAVARFTSAGAPDSSFSGDGRATTDFVADRNDTPRDVALTSGGGIVMAGVAGTPDTPVADCGGDSALDFGVAAFTPAGALDTSFSGDGRASVNFGGTADNGYALVAQAEGPVLAAGRAGSDLAVARLEPDGDLDPTFSGDGRVTTDLAGCDVARDVILTEHGILAAGSTDGAAGSRFALTRYLWQEHVTESADPGATVSTPGAPEESNPVVTQVTTPSGGEVKITEAAGGSAPVADGFTLLDLVIAIEAPTESSADPLRIVFNIASSRLPPGGVGEVDVYRDGGLLADCVAGGIPSGDTACVLSREDLGGSAKLTVLTIEASDWEFSLRPALIAASAPKKLRTKKALKRGIPVTVENRYGQSTDRFLLSARGMPKLGALEVDGEPAGAVTKRLKIRKRFAKRLLKRRRVKVTAKATASAPGTAPASATRTITLRR